MSAAHSWNGLSQGKRDRASTGRWNASEWLDPASVAPLCYALDSEERPECAEVVPGGEKRPCRRDAIQYWYPLGQLQADRIPLDQRDQGVENPNSEDPEDISPPLLRKRADHLHMPLEHFPVR